VGYPHDIKGQGIYAYVTLKAGQHSSEDLRKELVAWVRKEIGPIATPDVIQWAPGLPKTRSGKIMRRILRKIAENDFGNLGDTLDSRRSRGSRGPGQEPREVTARSPMANPTISTTRRRPGRRPHHLAQAYRGSTRPHRGRQGEGKRRLRQDLAHAGTGRRRGKRRAAQGGDESLAARRHSGLDQESLQRGGRDDACRLQGAGRCAARRVRPRPWWPACVRRAR